MALTDQLLNHFKDKFGIVTVVNATFYDVDGKVPKISFDTLKMSNITSEGQQKEIRGGQGAELLLQYDFGRTANVEITDALVSVGSLEYLFGGTQSTGVKQFPRKIEGDIEAAGTWPAGLAGDRVTTEPTKAIFVRPDGTKFESEGAFTTPNYALPTISASSTDPKYAPAGTKFMLFYVAQKTVGAEKIITGAFVSGVAFGTNAATAPADYLANSNVTVVWTNLDTGDVHTFVSVGGWPVIADLDESVAIGDTYTIYYITTTNQGKFGFKEMVLRASDFPPIVRFIGETVVLDADTGRKIAMQIEIPKLKLNANFTLSFDAEGDPSVFDFSGVALSHNGDLLVVRTLGEY